MSDSLKYEEVKALVENAIKLKDLNAIESGLEQLTIFDSKDAIAFTLFAKGELHRNKMAFEEALNFFKQALHIFEELGDFHSVGKVSNGAGSVYFLTGSYTEALKYYEKALQIYVGNGDSNAIARTKGLIGNVQHNTGNFSAAWELYTQANQHLQLQGDSRDLAVTTTNLGVVQQVNGNYIEALQLFHESKRIYESIGDERGVALATGNIGAVHQATGNYSAALDYYTSSLEKYERVNNPHGIAHSLGNIGNIHTDLGHFEAAVDFVNKSVDLYLKLNDRSRVAWALCSMLDPLIALGRYEEAAEKINQSEQFDILNPTTIIRREVAKANLARVDNDYETAKKILKGILKIAEENNLRPNQADIHRDLCLIAKIENNLDDYVLHNELCNRLNEEVRGAAKQRLLAIQEKEHELDVLRREQEKERTVLYSTLPKHVADRIIRGEKVTDNFEDASVMFLDVVGFTSMASHLSPQHVVELLEELFSICDSICEKYGITKVKTIGDAYLAVCGIPTPVEKHPLNMALASKEIISALSDITIDNIGKINVRIGLNCGPVVAGVVGKDRLQYDVWGDTVNMASRMESSGSPGKIHMSANFASALDRYETNLFYESHITEIKGKGIVTSYWLL